MSDSFPRVIDDVSCDWLSEVFGAPVSGFDKTFLPGGVLADAYKLNLRYSGASNGAPESAVIKLATEIDDQREMATDNDAYLKELRFFQELAETMPIGVPEVYACADDGSDNAEYFVILMEDLSTHSRVFDQLRDPPQGVMLEKFCHDIADLHGSFWESEQLTESWIGEADGRYVFTLESLCEDCPENLDVLCSAWESTYGKDMFTEVDAPHIKELSQMLAGPHSRAILEYMSSRLDERPKTLLHGDLRADNIFRSNADTEEQTKLTYIDWQILHAGPPGPDFTQAWAHSLPPETRRHDKTLLKGYHDHLVQVNPAAGAYSYDMLIEDYQLGYLLYWMAIISALATSVPGLDESTDRERMTLLYAQVIRYMFVAMEEHDSLGMARRIVAEVA